MTAKDLSLTTLDQLDNGRVGVAFKQALKRCVEDVNDRPAVTKARTITMKMEVTPSPSDIDEATFKVIVQDNVPKRESKPYVMQALPSGGLRFQDFAPDDPRQTTIDAD